MFESVKKKKEESDERKKEVESSGSDCKERIVRAGACERKNVCECVCVRVISAIFEEMSLRLPRNWDFSTFRAENSKIGEDQCV